MASTMLQPLPCNLIVTYDPKHRATALAAVQGALADLGLDAQVLPGSPPGVLEAHVPGDAREVVRRVRELARRDPARFAHTHRWRPVDRWGGDTLAEMRRAVQPLAREIGAGEPWRMTVQVHGPSPWGVHDLLGPLTNLVTAGRVDLEHAARELRVDVLGPRVAVSLLGGADELRADEVRERERAMPQDV